METSHFCPQCQQPLAADAPEGLCPQCLLNAAAGPPPSGVGDGLPGDLIDIANPDEVAKKLPQFQILELLGRGGMGVVYKARQVQLDRVVALKILPPIDALSLDFIARFTREARAMARLNHPNIVAVHDFGETNGVYFIVMEYVDGLNLRQLQNGRKLSPAEALTIIPKICEALQYAHEEGLVHRDIKPENLLIDTKGRVKIADFGLAKMLCREPLDMTLTVSGMAIGTLRYMAPEQLDKPEAVDHRADIYSLGVVFYELLTGVLPMGHFELPSQKASVDERLDRIVLHALERLPERRYQQASHVKNDVENVTSTPRPVAASAAAASAAPTVSAPANQSSAQTSPQSVSPASGAKFWKGAFIVSCAFAAFLAGFFLLPSKKTPPTVSQASPAPIAPTPAVAIAKPEESLVSSPDTAHQTPPPSATPMGRDLATENRASTPAAVAAVAATPKILLEEKNFRVTSILVGGGTTPSLAVINGRPYGEGEFIRTPKGSPGVPPVRVRVTRIEDKQVELRHEDQTIVVPLRRPGEQVHVDDAVAKPVDLSVAEPTPHPELAQNKNSTGEAKTSSPDARIAGSDKGPKMEAPVATPVSAPVPAPAHAPEENSLGQRFVPVGDVEFCIWTTRVKDFEQFAEATHVMSMDWRHPGFKQGPDHPVVKVTWQEATAFCQWLTDKEHQEGVLPPDRFYRLPTDLEWSKAVGLPEEAGRTPEARDMDVPDVYPWGTVWPPPPGAGNYTGEETGSDVAIKGYNDGFRWTSPVGSFKPNQFGLYDMGGNVWQWCMDSWNEESKAKVLRGGSWYNGALKLSLFSSCRVHAAPESGTDNYGFRVVRATTPPATAGPSATP